MKKSVQIASAISGALVALMMTTNAQAYISTADETSYIVNHTNGCVRAYVGNRQIDVPPHTSSAHFDVSSGLNYMVSVFPTAFCGNSASHNLWFSGEAYAWTVNH